MIELSVIIPMYNASKYVTDAIESILSQKNIKTEIIIVDDGSTDNSLDVVSKFLGNQHIKLFKQQNNGAGSARNLGLKKALGKYVMFLDADDYLSNNNICHECIDEMEKRGFDITIFSYKYYNEITNNITIPWSYPEINFSHNYIDIPSTLISSGIFPASPCYRIINREFLLKNNIWFREGCTAEDIDWFIKTLIYLPKLRIKNNCCYIYRKGITESVTSKSTGNQCVDLLKSINESISIINKEVVDQRLKNLLMSAISYEYCILLSNIYPSGKYDSIELELKSLKFLFNYTNFPKVKYIALISHFIPLKVLSMLLCIYRKKFAKSNHL